MIEMSVIDAADQQFGAIMNNQRVTVRLRYSAVPDRWYMDLSLDDLPVLYGRKVVTGVDLVAGLSLGIGMIFALPVNPEAPVVDRQSLPSGRVKLYQATFEELTS